MAAPHVKNANTPGRTPARRALRLATAACAVAILGVWALAGPSLGQMSAGITNSSAAAGSGTLRFTHTYTGSGSTCTSVPSGQTPSQTSFPCANGIQPTTATPTTGSASATDSISYTGTVPAAQVSEKVSAASCGPVKLDNRLTATNPLLSRYGTSYAPATGPMTGAGAITLDGANPGGYETSVLSQTQPNPIVSLNNVYALGVWFKTASTTGGPLLGFGDSPADIAGTNDRILYLTAAGRVGFGYNTGNSVVGPPTSGTTYNNNAWHFAYVTMTTSSFGLSLTTITVYVDGTQTSTFSGFLSGLSSYAGYWHLGWSPLTSKSYGTGLANYFTGSLSNFVVWNGGAAPTAATISTTSQSAFTASLGTSATEQWLLNDTGTTTFGGPYPLIGTTDPCTLVNLSWGFTNPTSCGWSPASTTTACTNPPAASLRAFVTAGAQTVAAPAPGTTQVSTVRLSRAASYNASFLPGLRLYAPLSLVASSGTWTNTFSWSDPTSAFIA